jgi:hypothetical protein
LIVKFFRLCFPASALVRRLARLIAIFRGIKEHFAYKLSGESRRHRNFHHRYNGERCFIIGTGPSLNSTDLEALSSEYTFAVKSYIFTGINRFNLSPTFFCWSDRGTLIKSLPLLVSLIPEELICFFPFAVRDRVNRFLGSRKQNIFFIRDIYEWNVQLGLFSADPSDLLHCSGSVIIDYCIPLAIYMGFKQIYLLGCDHCNRPGGVRHFDGRRAPLSGISTPWDVVTEGYRVVAGYAAEHGIEIYNATRGGELEVFPRVSLEDVLLDQSVLR